MNNLDISDVVQELELKMKLAFYGLLWSLGNQYIVGNFVWACLNIYNKSYKANLLIRKKQFQHIKVRCKGLHYTDILA